MTRPTRYEIAATAADGRRFLVGYTPRKSRQGLLIAMQNVGPELVAALGIGEDDEMRFVTKPRIHCAIGADVVVGFTGRTENDTRSEGALPALEA